MKTDKQGGFNPFVKLESPVTLASSHERVVRTSQAGRVIGFGCSSEEEQAHEALVSFAKQARENPDTASDPNFRQQLHDHIQKLEDSIVSSHGSQGGQSEGNQ